MKKEQGMKEGSCEMSDVMLMTPLLAWNTASWTHTKYSVYAKCHAYWSPAPTTRIMDIDPPEPEQKPI